MLIPSELINKPEEVCKLLESHWGNIDFDLHYYENEDSLIITALLQFVKVKLTICSRVDNTNAINEFVEMVNHELAKQTKLNS